MLEILSPAGSPEGVVAAVQNGADAVYLGFGGFNARRNAKNFTEEEFRKAAEYCRVRGVKVHVTLNTLVSDRELPDVVEAARTAARCGADAVIVQDLGVMRAIRQAVPDLPLHASTQVSIHNLDGVRMAAAMGASRVVLARELSRDEIAHICANSPVEIEVFAHGALCMCYSGQCYMSSVIGRRSGNRGLCAQPCRQSYSAGTHGVRYPLSLKDNCLIDHLKELEAMGVTSIKIEGRMKRPEYAAVVTEIYSKAVKLGEPPTEADMKALHTAFSRQGFTDGYYTDRRGPDMFGMRDEDDAAAAVLFSNARRNYLNGEYQRVPVRFYGLVRRGETAKLAAEDDAGNRIAVEGPFPEPAVNRETTSADIRTQLHRTGGTPYLCSSVRIKMDRGLSLPVSAINDMRRRALSGLTERRAAIMPREEGVYSPEIQVPNGKEPPVITVSVARADQLSDKLLDLRPSLLYFPLAETGSGADALRRFLDGGIPVAVSLPRVIHDNESADIERMLDRCAELGIKEALAGNLGHIMMAKKHGFDVRGDFGLNIYNSDSLGVVRDLGLISATASFELRLEQIRDMSKSIDTEMIVYGRLPLMITENCIVHSALGAHACDSFSGITDRTGATFPVMREYGCRNTVYNSKKLFLADRKPSTDSLGLWASRLAFSTENSAECAKITARYLGRGRFEPSDYTRGLYFRGVE